MYTANKIETFHPAYGCRHAPSRLLLILCLLISGLFSLAATTPATAATYYYCDPVNGNTAQGDGSAGNPWGTLQSVFAAGKIGATKTVRGGDTVKLLSGYHGIIKEYDYDNGDYITIEPNEGATPTFGRFRFYGCEYWKIKGITVSPELVPGGPGPEGGSAPMIGSQNHPSFGDSDYILIEDCNVYSIDDSSGWDADDWNAKACRGIEVQGSNAIIRDNAIKNVEHGIVMGSTNSLCELNTIENYREDGIRLGICTDSTVQYNTIRYCYKTDPNSHNDGIQIYTSSDAGEIRNITIEGNYILTYSDPEYPLRGSAQGILCNQPGQIYEMTIKNNVVIVEHYWGMVITAPTDSTIINNTVIVPPGGDGYAVISLYPTGGQASNVIVRNNISTSFPTADTLNNIVVGHNLDLDDYDRDVLFVDYQNYNVHLRKGSPAIDAGSSDSAPNIDADKNSRPQGAGFDIGCYEYVALNLLYGDVNGNGEVTSYDAALAARYAVGLETFTDEQRQKADVSANGEVSAYDAALIAQKAVGLIDRFPVEE